MKLHGMDIVSESVDHVIAIFRAPHFLNIFQSGNFIELVILVSAFGLLSIRECR